MTRGILTYNWGTGGIPRLFVMLTTLRKFYDGILGIMIPSFDTNLPAYEGALLKLGVEIYRFEVPAEFRDDLKVTAKLWIAKASPFDETVIYENDFLFQGDPSPIFGICGDVEFGIANYHGVTGVTKGTERMVQGLWRDFPHRDVMVNPTTVSYNHGVIYIRHGAFLRTWEKHTREWRQWTCAEEHINNIMVNMLPRAHAGFDTWAEIPQRFNMGVRFGRQHDVRTAVALHYLGGRHISGSRKNDCLHRWRAAYSNLLGLGLPCELIRTGDVVVAAQVAQGLIP